MSRITGRLEITVYDARDLRKEDVFKMDPYTKIELRKEVFKTKTHKKGGTNPKWEQSFLFNLKDAEDKEIIHFQVFDEDLLSDDKIGRADLPLSVLATYTDKKDGAWIQLVDFDNFKKIAGYLRVGVKFDGSGWPVKKEEEKKEEKKLDHHPEYPHLPPPPPVIHEPPPLPVYQPPVGYVPPPIVHTQPVYVPPTTTPSSPTTPVYVIPQPVYVPPTQPYIPSQPVPVYTPPTSPVTVVTIPETPRTHHKDVLENENSLFHNEKLTSPSGRFVAVFQGDSNFVLYEGSRPYWASKTVGSGGTRLYMQHDNNLVIYDAKMNPVWHTETYGKAPEKTGRLVLQDDGNLVLYSGSSALWASNTVQETKKSFTDTLPEGGRLQAGEKLTSTNGQYVAVFQGDGNFVVYQGDKATWSSGTHGTGAAWVTLQGDDNLVIYDSHTRPKWASNTWGKGSGTSRLTMQNDGNLVLYAENGTALWSSQSGLVGDHKYTDTLPVNGRLNHNQKITSRNGKYTAVLQSDGNFVVYAGTHALWASNTWGKPATYIILQADGNLVLYDDATKPHWSSETWGKNTTGDVRLVMQDDGNLVIYSGTTATWASNTVQRVETDTLKEGEKLTADQKLVSSDGRYRAVQQSDGNFVVYGGSALWASSTFGSGFYTVLQGDRNLVVYDSNTQPKWSSNTWGKGSGTSKLVMQSDGNLVLYDGTMAPLWATNTWGKY